MDFTIIFLIIIGLLIIGIVYIYFKYITLLEDYTNLQSNLNIKQSDWIETFDLKSDQLIDETIEESIIDNEIYPKHCENCPDERLHERKNISKCSYCGKWFCEKHLSGHINKNHMSNIRVKSTSTGGGIHENLR
jgi:hypothetical protein